MRALCPDPVLSTPLPSEDLTTRKLEPFIVIEATTLAKADLAGHWLTKKLGVAAENSHSFQLLWDLQSAELSR